MKYSYFAPHKGGKFFIRSLFQYNQKSYSFLSTGYIPFTIITKPCNNGYHSYEWNWEDKFSHELKSWYEVRHLETIEEVLFQKHESSGMSFTDKHKFAKFPVNLYKIFPRIYESDIVINPLTSLGYCSMLGSREMNWSMRMRRPPMNVDLEYSINELKNRRNILAYKENLYDWVHNFFIEGYIKILEEQGEDTYVNYITNKINESRKFEKYLKKLLEYYKIPYETFSLDTGDYCKTFGLSKSIDISLHDNRFTTLPDILREKSKTWTENYLMNH